MNRLTNILWNINLTLKLLLSEYMNKNIKTFLLTLIALACLTIAMIEISGISTTAFVNKFGANKEEQKINDDLQERKERAEQVKNMAKTKIEFETPMYDFGTIQEGAVMKHAYTFKNVGDAPLLISEVLPSCGCTVAEFTKRPIMPNETGTIDIQFDSKGRPGVTEKHIIILSNADAEKVSIGFKGTVEKK